MIVADTGAIVALVDASDRYHRVLRELYESSPHEFARPLPAIQRQQCPRHRARQDHWM